MSENGKDGERLRSGASPFLFFGAQMEQVFE